MISYFARDVNRLGGFFSSEKRNGYKIKLKPGNQIQKLFMNISITQICLKDYN